MPAVATVPKPRRRKPVGRKRRAAAWPLFVLALLVATTWLASRSRTCTIAHDGWIIDIYRGRMEFGLLRSQQLHNSTSFAGISSQHRGIDWWAMTPDELGAVSPPETWSTPLFSYTPDKTYALSVITIKTGADWRCSLVLWFPAALFAASGGLLFTWGVWARRRTNGRCSICHYDLTGLPANSTCPECGSSPT